jgi:O-antigen ligase
MRAWRVAKRQDWRPLKLFCDFTQPRAPFILPEQMNHESLDRFFERAILAVVLGLLVFAPLAMGAVGTWEFLVVQALAMAVMFLWALRIIFSRKACFFWPPLCWAVLAFALYAIARYLTADIEYVARFEMIQTLLYAFLFFAILNNLPSKESSLMIAFVLVFLAAGISCYGVWQFMARSNRVWNLISPYTGRTSGTFIYPNNFACFLEMTLPLSVAFLLVGRVKPLTRVFLGYAALAMAGGLAVTFSRSGWAAAAVALSVLLVVLMCHRKHRLPALLALVMLLAGGTFFVTKYLSKTLSYVSRIESVENNSIDLGHRLEMWQAAEEMWQYHFWFGVGPAHYDYRFRQYRLATLQERPGWAHNDYLNLLADWGATGGIIVVSGMLIFGVTLARTWKAVRPDDFGRGMSNRFAFFLGASAALLALAIHSVGDFNLHIPANALLGICFLALLTGQFRMATSHYQLDAPIPAKILLVALLAGAISYFGVQGHRRSKESAWQTRAANVDLPLLERADLLKKALAFEPTDFAITYQIGELYRIQSFQGGTDYESLAQDAMQWYSRGMKLDPHDGYNFMGYGMCLDWLGRHDEAETYFSQAQALDPNGYYTIANIGWHYVQTGDYAAARECFIRSVRLDWNHNDLAQSYLEIAQNKLIQNASGQPQLPPGF